MTLFAAGILFGSGLTIIIISLCLTASLDLTVHFIDPPENPPTNQATNRRIKQEKNHGS